MGVKEYQIVNRSIDPKPGELGIDEQVSLERNTITLSLSNCLGVLRGASYALNLEFLLFDNTS